MRSVYIVCLALSVAILACEPLQDERLTGQSGRTSSASIANRQRPEKAEQPAKAKRERPDREDRAKRERPRRPSEPAKAQKQAEQNDGEADEVDGDSAAKAPARYSVKLNTTKGDVVIDVTRSWAPRGADRFHELVKAGYYDNCAFFRVLDGFMAQTGINGDPAVNDQWRTKRIQDDPVEQSNRRGMVSFAMAGPNTRTTQFFINYRDNSRLDGMGFSAFGRVRDMQAVDALFSGYGEGAPRGKGPSQARIQREGNAYLKAEFPNLDYIRSAQILQE